jgi:hypothetical protein
MPSPYLQPMRERYEHVRAAAEEIVTRAAGEHRNLTFHEQAEMERHVEEATSLLPMIEQATEVDEREQRHAEVAGQLQGVGEAVQLGAGTPDPYAALGAGERVPALVPPREQVAELYRAAGDRRGVRVEVDQRPQLHQRAVVTLAGDVGSPVAAMDRPVSREPRRISTSAGLTVQTVNGSEGVAFPVFGAGAAGIVGENVTKPEYDAVTPGSATPQMIAIFTDYTHQAAMTVTSFEARLRAKLGALVARREDQLLIASALATPGIQTYTASGTVYADALLGAAALVLDSDVAADPDVAVIHPADVSAVFGGSIGRSGESPESELRLTLHGMTVYVSSAVTVGTALVGAWRASSRFVVGMRPTMLIDPYSGLKLNRITMRLEEAVALAVDEPTGFVSVTFPPAA